jgi:hypothetical protein
MGEKKRILMSTSGLYKYDGCKHPCVWFCDLIANTTGDLLYVL